MGVSGELQNRPEFWEFLRFDTMPACTTSSSFSFIHSIVTVIRLMKPGGSVAIFGRQHTRGTMPRSHSDYNPEQPSDEMELADNPTHAHPSGLPLPNRMHRFVTLDRAVGSPERAEALARSHPPLDGPMILLQDVIKVLHRPQSTSTPQRAFCLQLFNDWRVGRILIHIDDSRRWVVR